MSADRGFFFENDCAELRIALDELPGGGEADDAAADYGYVVMGH
jgi:hypothetical protein